MIEALYEASQAGVEIDLIVRGHLLPRPGRPGLSERIRVRSIVGRYLEHSRIYRFANGAGTGPAALPHRLGRPHAPQPRSARRGAGARRRTRTSRTGSQEILDVNLADDVLAWELGPDGVWRHVAPGGEVDTHVRLQEIARTRVRRRA